MPIGPYYMPITCKSWGKHFSTPTYLQLFPSKKLSIAFHKSLVAFAPRLRCYLCQPDGLGIGYNIDFEYYKNVVPELKIVPPTSRSLSENLYPLQT